LRKSGVNTPREIPTNAALNTRILSSC
jgi:hypothetical protein